MWFDKIVNLQTLPTDLEKLYQKNGWKRDLFFRIRNGTSKYIDVRLFESLGSDLERRRFGFAMAYDTADSDFADARYVSTESRLGNFGIGDGTTTEFQIPTSPIVPTSLLLYVNSELQDKSTYSIDGKKGKIKFNSPVPKGGKVTGEYRLANDAYEPTNDMIFFTYTRYFIEKEVNSTDAVADLGNGNGTKTTFNLPFTDFDESRFFVYKNKNVVDSSEYTFTSKSIEFKSAPSSSENITISGTRLLEPNENGELSEVLLAQTSFDVQNTISVMTEIFTSINFINASPFTVLSFTPEQRFTKDWKRDSVVYMYGNANKDRIVMFMRIDPTPSPVRALFVPLYIGKMHTFDKKPQKNLLIMSGCRKGEQFSNSIKQIGKTNVDYGENTSGGNLAPMLAQSLTGSMYQKHYLAFITHHQDIDSGQGRFNPSMYSGKYHLSQMYIVHPNDGYVGKLDDVYAVHPKNIQQADELEIEKTVVNEVLGDGDGVRKIYHLEHKPQGSTLSVYVDCKEVPKTDYEYNADEKTVIFKEFPIGEITASYKMAQLYRYTLPTTEVSPFTTSNSPFNPIGLAIYKEDL
ncbi:DUF2460 domain-containing protein [Bacillus cereus group sp. BfR-BA-01360]|uniref:DUF2460 domain-containing protein n=1 Tax=Bacillus cereus group sp. BfR-BA-01360 TaxID=2920321 RepID=UPI001F571811|nr:DUF2460 domain-containing protein [Bacillus cereus group sp. BfR-BA-01360]